MKPRFVIDRFKATSDPVVSQMIGHGGDRRSAKWHEIDQDMTDWRGELIIAARAGDEYAIARVRALFLGVRL